MECYLWLSEKSAGRFANGAEPDQNAAPGLIESKKKGNDQELIQSNLKFRPKTKMVGWLVVLGLTVI